MNATLPVAVEKHAPTGRRCRVLVVEQGEGLWGAQRYLLRLAPLLAERGIDQILAAGAEQARPEAQRLLARVRDAIGRVEMHS